MSDLRELYQQVILDHYKRPRNFRKVEGHNHCAQGHNPLCGDRINVYLKLDGEKIEDVGFKGTGCAISKASASLMTQALKGMSRRQAEALFRKFHDLLTRDPPVETESLGKLAVFAGVREFPIRVKCATLAWHTLAAALNNQDGRAVTTE